MESFKNLRDKEVQPNPREEAHRLLDLIDEKAWHVQNGTLETEEQDHNFSFDKSCDKAISNLSKEGQKEFAEQLHDLCLPNYANKLKMHPGRTLEELQHYTWHLMYKGKNTEALIVKRALELVSTSDSVAYIYAQRAKSIVANINNWIDKGVELMRRQGSLELGQEKTAPFLLAPNVYALYFEMGGIRISSDPKNPKSFSKRLSTQNLFRPSMQEMPHETESTMLLDYLSIRNPKTFHLLPSHIQEGFTSIPIPEQAQVVRYMQECSVKNFKNFDSFVQNYGPAGLRTFLSCEYGMKMGDIILELGQRLPPETAKKVFSKYAEIVDISEQTLDYLEKTKTEEKEYTSEKINSIKESLLASAKDFLLKLADSTSQRSEKEILDELAHKKADLLLLAAFYRQADLKKENFPGLKFEQKISSTDLSPTDKERMIDLARFNYRATPDFAEKIVLPSLQRGLADENNYFYILRKDNEIAAFVRFEPQGGEGNFYIGSFNVDENAQGAGIGQTFFGEVIKREGRDKRLFASVELDKPIASFYINKVGFVATNVLTNVEGTRLNGLKIVYDHRQKDRHRRPLAEKSYTEEELTSELQEKLSSGQFVLTYLDRDPKTGKYFVSLEPVTETETLAA